jgi:preprotein translocase subunit SecG
MFQLSGPSGPEGLLLDQIWRKVVSDFVPYVQFVQIIISIALVVVILVQAKGQGGLGGIFGGEGGVYRTRRGVEKTLFNVTVGLAVAFFFISIATVLIA